MPHENNGHQKDRPTIENSKVHQEKFTLFLREYELVQLCTLTWDSSSTHL